ncbi:hypothetical protein D3C78_488560 [compost metagenome]
MIDPLSLETTVVDSVYSQTVLDTLQTVTAPAQVVVLNKRQEDGVLTIVYTALLVTLLLLYFIRKKGRGNRV